LSLPASSDGAQPSENRPRKTLRQTWLIWFSSSFSTLSSCVTDIRLVESPALWRPTSSNFWCEFLLMIWRWLKVSIDLNIRRNFRILLTVYKIHSSRQRGEFQAHNQRLGTHRRGLGTFKPNYRVGVLTPRVALFSRWSNQGNSTGNPAPVGR
jgi:hypothetical protein